MTVSDASTSFRYEGNGSTDTFAYTGRIFNAGDLVVEIITRATDALEETLTITTDYTVTINGDESASIQTVPGKIPSATQDIQIRSAVAQSQTVHLPTGTVFPAKSVEDALDKNVVIIQQLSDDVDRSVKLSATSSLSNIVLPTPIGSEVIGWNASADELTSYSFAELSTSIDTVFTSLANGDLLQYDGTNWVNVSEINTAQIADDAITAAKIDINGATDTVITATDEILFGDISDSNNIKKDTVQGILDLVLQTVYSVGSYYTSDIATSPATVLGFGTWEAVEDAMLIGASATYTAGSTGGSATTTQTSSQLASHTHTYRASASSGGSSASPSVGATTSGDPSGTATYTSSSAGSGSAMTTISPYRAVYIWRRTA